jgi:hypothetical protein
MDGADAVNYILQNNIEGCIIECGVDSGYFEHIWINELMKNNAVRDIYLFDTFSGLVEPTEYDYTCKDAKLYQMNKDEVYKTWKNQVINEKVNGWCYTPLDKVKQRLNSTGYHQNNVDIYSRKILHDYRMIAQKCGKWYEYIKEKFEIIDNKIVKYNGIKKDYIFLDSKSIKWDYYERSTSG